MSGIPKGNSLVDSSSPYLLQHANNPVNWFPWSDEALKLAKQHDKPIIVSIGYSACHWCHVMEVESFNNQEIANLMNENFICIKVDREERPDVDQIYMEALQVMGLRGGWPLNVLLTPDQKPFYGGTYFSPPDWSGLLENVVNVFKARREELEESAEKYTNSLRTSDLERFVTSEPISALVKTDFLASVQKIKANFDDVWGGLQKVPKFPIPASWNYLLEVFEYYQDEDSLSMTALTLEKMASGGIYDHIGGGFARYSTDDEWHIPHFEKMLYDNGQLLSLFANAHSRIPDADFSKLIRQTISWLKTEMLSPNGGFYAAMDADSEGEEGKFYTWTYDDFINIPSAHAGVLADFYDVRETGNWEEGKNTLRTLISVEEYAKKIDLDRKTLIDNIHEFESEARKYRNNRVKPALDDKILASWNGLTIRGLSECYKTLQDISIAELSVKTGDFILNNLIIENQLYRNFKNSKASIPAFLEDYAWVIDGFIGLYEISLDFKWLKNAKSLTDYAVKYFYDSNEGFFFYTDENSEQLLARKKEFIDHVMPSSNAGMAKNLYLLGQYFQDDKFLKVSNQMIATMSQSVTNNPGYLTYWASAGLLQANPTTEVVIAGDFNQKDLMKLLNLHKGNLLIMGASEEEQIHLPLTKGKNAINDEVTFYVCRNKTCQLPVKDITSAIRQIKNENT